MQKYFSILLLVAFSAVLSGCGSDGKMKTDRVSGTITYKGAPLVEASVTFIPKVEGQGHTAYGMTDNRGVYQLQTMLGRADAGTTPGEYDVRITKLEYRGSGKFREEDGEQVELQDAVSVVPEKYGAPESGLSATVVKGRNVFNFDLQ